MDDHDLAEDMALETSNPATEMISFRIAVGDSEGNDTMELVSCREIDGKKEELGFSTSIRKRYSRSEMEAARFFDVDEQRRMWNEVYLRLGSDIVKEYDGLRANCDRKRKPRGKKKNADDSRDLEASEKGPKAEEVSRECSCLLSESQNKGEDPEQGELESKETDERRTNCLEVDGREGDLGWTFSGFEGVSGISRRKSYTRSEMEVLRFSNVREQRTRWKEVYQRLESDVVREYDGLGVQNHRKQQKQCWGEKNDASDITGEMFTVNAMRDSDGLPFSDLVCNDTLACSGNKTDSQELLEEYENREDEDDSSSDEYVTIQRPAFFVEGEPDFESGPPLDGWEYLRRVRWEAAQIPKVKVVKINPSKLNSEQTPYMPNIPEIPKCPPNLLPEKDWEDAFLSDFSALRQAISLQENSCDQPLAKVGKASECSQKLKKNDPTVTVILGMDAVSRAATLRSSISALEEVSSISRNDCLWLFALCAAVDTPFHGDTAASLRCLLRKCSCLLAKKSEPDDEVAMLSILTTIAGKYFGQSDTI